MHIQNAERPLRVTPENTDISHRRDVSSLEVTGQAEDFLIFCFPVMFTFSALTHAPFIVLK